MNFTFHAFIKIWLFSAFLISLYSKIEDRPSAILKSNYYPGDRSLSTVYDVYSESYTSKTGRVLVAGNAKVYVGASTNVGIYARYNDNNYTLAFCDGYAGAAAYQNLSGITVLSVPKNQAVTITLRITGNSANKVMSYNSICMTIVDI